MRSTVVGPLRIGRPLRGARALSGATALLKRVPGVVWPALIAVTVTAVYGRGHVGYDEMYSLLWGRDIAHGAIPDLQVPVAPTPHPLAIVLGALLSPLGTGALPASQAVVTVTFAALGWGAFQLGRQLFSPAVGALFMAILMTRRLLAVEELQASVDIPFLALVVWAAVLEARRPRSGPPVLVALGVAGLLRPEAWLLSALYCLYLFPGADNHRRARIVAIAAIAPLLWLVFDVVATGDPLHSLHETQSNAELLERPRRFDQAVQATPVYLQQILNEPIVWGGIAGAVAALYALYDRSVVPAALLALGLGTFLVIGAFGLPLLTRYLLLPAVMLALFCAVAALGWRELPRPSAVRTAWIAGSAILVGAFILSLPAERRRVQAARSWTSLSRSVQQDLYDLATAPGVAGRLARCPGPTRVPNFRVVPLLSFALDEGASAFAPHYGRPRRGALISPANSVVAASLILYPGEPIPVVGGPRGFRRVYRNASWELYTRC